jgi:U3 small nucleolar ribonucleoprotein protein IMP4
MTLLCQVSNILKYLFPVPKEDSKRIMTFANENDYISFRCMVSSCFDTSLLTSTCDFPPLNSPLMDRHHVYVQKGKEIELREVGPRFELKLFQVKLGTLDQAEAETEYVLKPYMNTAKKRKAF